jgi:hypothetical protein
MIFRMKMAQAEAQTVSPFMGRKTKGVSIYSTGIRLYVYTFGNPRLGKNVYGHSNTGTRREAWSSSHTITRDNSCSMHMDKAIEAYSNSITIYVPCTHKSLL